MCGDGTNDVGALKVSDVGVALVSASLVAPPPPRARPNDDDGEGGASGARARKAGKGGRGSERADGAEAVQQLEAPMLKLGDASIAAAFTAKNTSVSSCVDIVLQGRCALVTTLQMCQILALNCLVNAYSLSVLHLEGVRISDTQVGSAPSCRPTPPHPEFPLPHPTPNSPNPPQPAPAGADRFGAGPVQGQGHHLLQGSPYPQR